MWGKLNFGGNIEEGEEGFVDEDSEGLCSLSYTQRMYAFGGCLLTGIVCMFLSMIVFVKPIKFAILFTLGNLLAVGSTAFLFGPAQQLRMMFDPVRMYATVIYLGSVVLALICALLVSVKSSFFDSMEKFDLKLQLWRLLGSGFSLICGGRKEGDSIVRYILV